MYFSKFSKYLYKDATKLVCVSKAIENKIRRKFGFENTLTIYNPVVFSNKVDEILSNVPEKYILFFGRLEEQIKNFSLLLNSFKLSKVYEKGTKLLMVGGGPDKAFIETKIAELGLTNFVQLIPFQKNIKPYIQKAKCTVLSSRFEGFPMSLVESLAAGTPVISVDCESGPNEIIINRVNGLLLPNHNKEALAQAIFDIISDEDLYKTCKNNAKESVEHLSLENISKQWKQLLAKK